MVACQLLLMLLCTSMPSLLAYPVFGTKRYGRSTHHLGTWGVPAPLPIQPYQPPRTQAHHYGYGIASPAPYYPSEPIVSYPYAEDYSDSPDYYYPEPAYTGYPYYPTVYHHHAVLPYYYGNTHPQQQHHPGYGYYNYDDGTDPVEDIQEEIQQEEEREEREEALPIGQETWYENSSPSQEPPQQEDNMADVNAVFLHNLILSQMYNDAVNRGANIYQPPAPHYGYAYPVMEEEDSGDDGWVYGDVRANSSPDGYYYNNEEETEDEDVKELKSLVKKPSRSTTGRVKTVPSGHNGRTRYADSEEQTWVPMEGGAWLHNNPGTKRSGEFDEFQTNRVFNKKQPEYGEWVPQRGNPIKFTDRKSIGFVRSIKSAVTTPAGPAATTTVSSQDVTSTTVTPAPEFDARRGMKEVALLRPASPVHRPPFTTLTRSQKPRHGPSVYDTIKQLLNMEQGLRKEGEIPSEHPRPQKRFVSSEESLVEELSGLKKLAA